jgi:hypothetical protein
LQLRDLGNDGRRLWSFKISSQEAFLIVNFLIVWCECGMAHFRWSWSWALIVILLLLSLLMFRGFLCLWVRKQFSSEDNLWGVVNSHNSKGRKTDVLPHLCD